MTEGYASNAEYLARIAASVTQRFKALEEGLRAAFASAIETQALDVILFSKMKPESLAAALRTHPIVLKTLLAACNIAARSIERDLQIKGLDTYNPRLSKDEALKIAHLLVPHLPPNIPLAALSLLDRTAFIDKEVRKGKGQWEKTLTAALNQLSRVPFKKRTFTWRDDEYEIDAAAPSEGPIQYAIDVKRIEARRDIHKRSDEIINKADKFKHAFPNASFAAVIYYPFITEHDNIRARLRSDHIASVVFASEADKSILAAVETLLGLFKLGRR